MDTGSELPGGPTPDFEAWRHVLHSHAGLYSPELAADNTFAGTIHSGRIYGIEAIDLSCNIHRADRTLRHARLDGLDYYKAIFQVSGQAKLIQNDQIMELTTGDCGFADVARPFTIVPGEAGGRWVCLHMPREPFVAHVGLEPVSAMCWRRDMQPADLLFRLVVDAAENRDGLSAQAEPYMQLAIYDLLGALFTAAGLRPLQSHSDKLFARVCAIIDSHYADPGIRPHDVAAEAGISLRYLQKLFTLRGTTCTQFIHSRRLDHAARLLQRRASMQTRQPLSEIAHVSGFSDYAHFSRMFRQRFGRPPSSRDEHVPRGRR